MLLSAILLTLLRVVWPIATGDRPGRCWQNVAQPVGNVIDCSGSGSSAARLARSVRDAEVGGSNPLSPTIEGSGSGRSLCRFRCLCCQPGWPSDEFHTDRAEHHPVNDENPYRALPSVDQLLADPEITAAVDALPLSIGARLSAVSWPISGSRSRTEPARRLSKLMSGFCAALNELERERLEPVINGTGVVIHTNLGRAPVSRATAAAMAAAARHNVALEIDPATGLRGGRMSEISALIRLLTGAESTLIVNNNAAAILLVLSSVATGREVIVSRGEAVEIGGGFRIPDVLRQSGASLVEVGTTNRTYVRDYADAITDNTACLLKVHPSNFAISGFTHSASMTELAALGTERAIPVIEDLGSGALIDSGRYGLAAEPTIGESIRAGAIGRNRQRRQAARRTASGHHRWIDGLDRPDRSPSAGQGGARRQGLPGRNRRHAAPLRSRRGRSRDTGLADDCGSRIVARG